MLEDVYPSIAEELLTIAETVARTSVADVQGASREAGDAFSSFVLEDGDDEVAVRTDERQRRVSQAHDAAAFPSSTMPSSAAFSSAAAAVTNSPSSSVAGIAPYA